MIIDTNELSDFIPDDVKSKILECGKEQDIDVYRVAKSGIIDENTFLSSFEEYKLGLIPTIKDLQDVSTYSTSCYLDIKKLKKTLKMLMKYNPRAQVIKGKVKFGLSQITKERIPNKDSHVDWWIYKNQNKVLMSEFKIYYND